MALGEEMNDAEIDSADVRWAEMDGDQNVQAIHTEGQQSVFIIKMKIRGTDGRISNLQILGREDESAVYMVCTWIRYHGSCRP